MFCVRITPRLCETDALGHINNTAIPVWLEQGRTPIFEEFLGTLSLTARDTFPLLLAHLSMDFRHVVRFGQDVEVHTQVSRIGTSSFDLDQVIMQNDFLCVEARAILVHIDPASGTSRPIPDDHRRQLTEWMAQPPSSAEA